LLSSEYQDGRPRVREEQVRYTGRARGPAPLAWGQQTTWTDIQYFMPRMKYFFVMRQEVPVAAGVALGTVLTAVGELVSRYEALRSHYRTDRDGRGVQEVLDDGCLTVRVYTGPDADFGAGFAAEQDTVAGVPFQHERELPIRVLVGVRAGAPVAVGLAVSHVAVDAQGASLLAAELTRLIVAVHEHSALPEAPRARQPVDQAAIECSAAGQARNRSAMAYFRKQLRLVPADMFPDRVPADGPRYRRAELRSTSVTPALRILAERHRASTSNVLLAAYAAALHATTGTAVLPISLVFGNRVEPDLRHSISCLSQIVLSVVDASAASFGELVARASAASLRAFRHGKFDSIMFDEVVAEISAERGTAIDLMCRFNDVRPPVAPSPGPEDLAGSRAAVRLAPPSTFSWISQTDDDKISCFLSVYGDATRTRLAVLLDVCRIPADAVEPFLRRIENLLTVEALGGE
jgi:condensation domain-containing protein